MRYTDPSGHWYCDSQWADPEECIELEGLPNTQGGETPDPWTEDEGYETETDRIPDWSNNQSDASDISRAQKVWGWLCLAGGWWGTGCPSERDLATWLLWQEGGFLLNDYLFQAQWTNAARGAEIMVAYYNYLFLDGISAGDLGKMTAFFNPDGISPFSQSDWDELMTRPPSAAFNTVDVFWNSNLLDVFSPGVEVFWWTPDENPRGIPTISVFNLRHEPVFFFLMR